MQKLPDLVPALSHHLKPPMRDGSQFTCTLFHPRIDGGSPLDSAVESQQIRSHDRSTFFFLAIGRKGHPRISQRRLPAGPFFGVRRLVYPEPRRAAAFSARCRGRAEFIPARPAARLLVSPLVYPELRGATRLLAVAGHSFTLNSDER